MWTWASMALGIPEDDGDRYQDLLGQIRVSTIKILILVIIGISYALTMISISAIPSEDPPPPWYPLPVIFGLIITAIIGFLGLRYTPSIASILMVLGLSLTLAVSSLIIPGTFLVGYYFLVVLVAVASGGWVNGMGTAVFVSAITVGLQLIAPNAIPPSLSGNALIWIWSTLLLAWLVTRPLRTTVNWAWSSYSLAWARTEEARQRQAELAQLSRSLHDACQRLEDLNRELIAAREAAEMAKRMKAEFAATVGHELRTPVNLIIGFAQMMISARQSEYYNEPLPEVYRRDLETIYRNACHISELVDDVLDLSQVDAHRMALHKEQVMISRVVREAVDIIAPLYAEDGLYLLIDIPDNLPHVWADPVRIRQVLINLLYNSLRFTNEGGVVVTAYLTESDLVVSVHDTGIGIPSDQIGRIFEEFRQIHSPARGRGGSGFGLAVCKRFVEMHGGTIWAESAPDHGTTISFSLPLRKNVVSNVFRRLPNTSTSKQVDGLLKVAVLDDVGDASRVIRRYLDGCCVIDVQSLDQISVILGRESPDAVVVASHEVLREWRAYLDENEGVKGITTLFCPLRSRDVIARSLRVSCYLMKPVSEKQIAQALRGLNCNVGTLIVIEDDREMRDLLGRMIMDILPECHILETDNGIDGLRLISEARPDAVILDLLIPGLDGYSILQLMQSNSDTAQIPVIIVSAKGPEEEVRVGEIGISRYGGFTVGDAMMYLRSILMAMAEARQRVVDGGMVQALREEAMD